MNSALRTAFLLPLYPVLFVAGPFDLSRFTASLAGCAAFVVAYVTLKDQQFAATVAGAVVPIAAYLAGLAVASATVLAAHQFRMAFPKAEKAHPASPAQMLLELDSLARTAAQHALDHELAKLGDWEKLHIVLGRNLGERWAVYDWYVPGRNQDDARVIVRAIINRMSNDVSVEIKPKPELKAKLDARMVAFAIWFPIMAAAVMVSFAAILLRLQFAPWPSEDRLLEVGILSWAIWQWSAVAQVFRRLSAIPIRLPDGDRLLVDRVRLKRRAVSSASSG